MIKKLLTLLKKDAIISFRNKVWTIFEILFPVVLLIGTAAIAYMTRSKLSHETVMTEEKAIQLFKTIQPQFRDSACNDRSSRGIPMLPSVYEVFSTYAVPHPDCGGQSTIFVMHPDKPSKIDYHMYASSSALKTEDWGYTSKNYLYDFVALQYSNNLHLTKIQSNVSNVTEGPIQKLEFIPEVKTSFDKSLIGFIYTLSALSLLLNVINISRNIVAEKTTVKPYLAAMGMPSWLFYLAHFMSAMIKTGFIMTLCSLVLCGLLTDVNIVIFLLGMFFYVSGCIGFGMLCSTFFKTSRRAIEGSLIIYFSSVLATLFFKDKGISTLAYSLNINHAFMFFMNGISINVERESPFGFKEFFKGENAKYYPSAVYFGFLVFDTIWMVAATIGIDYLQAKIEAVGIKGLFCCFKKRSSAGDDTETLLEVSVKSLILSSAGEKDRARDGATADIDLKQLVKIYSTGEKAVNGLSFRAIRGQVSVLLGHNGCGKSTTFSMISGITMPTSGSVTIGGIDAIYNPREARKIIGLCPQYNPIFDKLTVMEHLKLIHTIKGGDPKTFKEEADELLAAINLSDKKKTQAAKLSGGMKRKLCVCMALIADSRVVLLDEPTAGMDPGARKDVQNLMENIKKDRTILLTTHYMDEAERLGDWVFVMSHGKMAASGTAEYLKKKFGTGYLLTVVLEKGNDRVRTRRLVERICKTFLPGATMKDQRGQMLEVYLPENDKDGLLSLMKVFETVSEQHQSMGDLDGLPRDVVNDLHYLRVTSVGINMSSLEQVFIKIGEECDKVITREKEKSTATRIDKLGDYKKLMDMKKDTAVGFSLLLSQFTGSMMKRGLYALRHYSQYFLQIVLPIGIFFLIALQSRKAYSGLKLERKCGLAEFPESLVYVKGADPLGIEKYLKGFSNLDVKKTSESVKSLVKKNFLKSPNIGFIVDSSGSEYKVLMNKEAYHGKPIIVNLISYINAKANNLKFEIEMTDFWTVDDSDGLTSSEFSKYMMAFSLMLLIGFITSPFVIFPIEERASKFTHQQFLAGLSQFTYWIMNLLWDFSFYLLVCIFFFIILISFSYFGSFWYLTVLSFFVYFYAIIPTIYTVSSFMATSSKASTSLITYQIILGLVASIVGFIITFLASEHFSLFSLIAYPIVPAAGFLFAILKIQTTESRGEQLEFGYDSIYQWEGITSDFCFMILSGSVFLAIFLMMQIRATRRFFFKCCHPNKTPIEKQPVAGNFSCPAVGQEEERVNRGNVDGCALVITNLVRTFGSFRAVNGLCLAVENNECFGMLGTNGAGKTTTFDILTGLRFPSGGTATIDGKDVSKNTNIGYCPQFDAVLPDLTGKELIMVIAYIHGYRNPKELTRLVLSCVGMTEHANKRIKLCSGGQKRKISVGIALLSKSNCVIFDEPTAGIDPRARREIWGVIDLLRDKSGASIILTSHSMEECEALCTRVAILKKGEMIALGTSQELKSQYGNTWTMTIILKRFEDREQVVSEVASYFYDSKLKTADTNITLNLEWTMPKERGEKWSYKFAKVQKVVSRLNVKDFMLIQSSLEETFINLTA